MGASNASTSRGPRRRAPGYAKGYLEGTYPVGREVRGVPQRISDLERQPQLDDCIH